MLVNSKIVVDDYGLTFRESLMTHTYTLPEKYHLYINDSSTTTVQITVGVVIDF